MDYIIMGVASAVIIAALLYFRRIFSQKGDGVSPAEYKGHGDVSFAKCPLCGTALSPGQNLRSKVFRSAASASDQLCYIYGCPFCCPECKPGISRTCPVCHKPVAQNSYLISRMFSKTKSGKPHVIINGCGNCNRREK